MKPKCLILLSGLLMFIGCGTSKEASRTGAHEPGEENNPYEATFHPSDHDPNIHILLGEDRDTTQQQSETQPGVTPSQPAELVAGFRVQLFSSTDIDEAQAKKAEAEALFPNDWIYLVYDPPTYKIRAGNFLARFEADRFLKQATEKGYQDAWVVPAKVFSNAPPPPSPPKNDETNRK